MLISMEANTEVIENDSRPCNRNDTENEVSSVSEHKKRFSILGRFCRVPDVPKRYVEPTILDTSLPYIPVYTHLKIYDLKPIERPTTPPILKELRLKFPDDTTAPESCRSSKASPSTGRSKGRSSITLKSRESETIFNRF